MDPLKYFQYSGFMRSFVTTLAMVGSALPRLRKTLYCCIKQKFQSDKAYGGFVGTFSINSVRMSPQL